VTPEENLKKKLCANIHKTSHRFKIIACSNSPSNTLLATVKISLQSIQWQCVHPYSLTSTTYHQ